MKRFVEGADRGQTTLLPECLDEWVEESNSVRVVDSFVDALDLADLGFEGIEPAATGRSASRSSECALVEVGWPCWAYHRNQENGPHGPV